MCHFRELPPQFLRKYLRIGSLAQKKSLYVVKGSHGLRAFKLTLLIEEGCLADDTFDISHDRTVGGVLLKLSTPSGLFLQFSQ